MMLLTKSNAIERCRTCLCKLLKDELPSFDENVVTTYQSTIVDININKELQDMIAKYLPMQWDVDFTKDKLFPHYLCMGCFEQLQSFEIFRNRALDNSKRLYKIFNNGCKELNMEVNDGDVEYKVDIEEQSRACSQNIFNIFLRDSLMETEAIILNDACSSDNVVATDPDPFQITPKEFSLKKPRGRSTNKNPSTSKNKTVSQRSRKSNGLSESATFKLRSDTPSINKTDKAATEDIDETLSCQNLDFKSTDDSSDNEELIKDIHSDRAVKGANIKSNYYNGNEENIKKTKCANRISTSDKVEKNYLDDIKPELHSNMSSESDNSYAAPCSKKMIIEKKTRHYILNSGRKKGLSNKYKCDKCQHKFGHKLTLEAHVRKVHEGQKKAFKCQLCDKAYSFIGGLSTHIRDVHERKQESFDCSVAGCDKKYSNLITLQRHVRVKHLNMESPHQYVCEQCGSTFKQSSNLRYHMKTRHPTEEDLKRKELLPKDRLECEECKKSFHSQYTLKYHKLRVHADEKKFECKICGRRVAKQFMLDSHMLVHSDQKMACKFCGREFVRKYQVEAHIKAVHQKLKPFQCPHCSESFASRKTLRHHIYIHTGEKPYVCDICGQAYRQPTCLKNHRKIHNKPSANNESLIQASNRNFISNFLLNNDEANEEK